MRRPLLALASVVASLLLAVSPPMASAGAAASSPVCPPGPSTGVSQAADGSFQFVTLHVDPSGRIVDPSGCEVRLVGLNVGAAFQGHGADFNLDHLTALKAQFPFNVARVSFNTRWWVEDAYLPDQHAHYRASLQSAVGQLEQLGLYVELDANTAFFEPPCGNDQQGTDIRLCPSEDQGERDYQAHPSPDLAEGLRIAQPIAVQALADLAARYGSDPAILFDVWNEPADYQFQVLPGSKQQFLEHMNERIDTVRQAAPNALVVVFDQGSDEFLSGAWPIYQQPNLVIDQHIYGAHFRDEPDNVFVRQARFWRSHGFGVIVNEWGTTGPDHQLDPGYAQALVDYVQSDHVGLLYFHTELLTTRWDSPQLNADGQLVAAGYRQLLSP